MPSSELFNKAVSKVEQVIEGSYSLEGDQVILADELSEQFKEKCKIVCWRMLLLMCFVYFNNVSNNGNE